MSTSHINRHTVCEEENKVTTTTQWREGNCRMWIKMCNVWTGLFTVIIPCVVWYLFSFFTLLLLLWLLLNCICERRIQYQSDNYQSVQYTAFHLVVRHTCIARISFKAYVARALAVCALVIVAVIMIIFIEALFFFSSLDICNNNTNQLATSL